MDRCCSCCVHPELDEYPTEGERMKVTGDNYTVISKNSNDNIYWEKGEFPDWVSINCFRAFPDMISGLGVEPHYHDCDEIWLFTKGHGEVWLNDQRYDITPNTAVYTPMGVIHRFPDVFPRGKHRYCHSPGTQKKDPFIFSLMRTVHRSRPWTDSLFPEKKNLGPIADPGPRCPVSELRAENFTEGEKFDEAKLGQNEHWNVLEGTIDLTVDGMEFQLSEHDIALLRAGAIRELHASDNARAVIAREKR